nr:hypothetical protein [Candidatus Sigynarchaeum springense]
MASTRRSARACPELVKARPPAPRPDGGARPRRRLPPGDAKP